MATPSSRPPLPPRIAAVAPGEAGADAVLRPGGHARAPPPLIARRPKAHSETIEAPPRPSPPSPRPERHVIIRPAQVETVPGVLTGATSPTRVAYPLARRAQEPKRRAPPAREAPEAGTPVGRPVGEVARPLPVQPVHQIARITSGGTRAAGAPPHRRMAVLALARPFACEPPARVEITQPARAAHDAPREATPATAHEKEAQGGGAPMPIRMADVRRKKAQTGRTRPLKPDGVTAVGPVGPTVAPVGAPAPRLTPPDMAAAAPGVDAALPAV